MGEYGTYRGESIKLGTCEDFYYLRAEQRGLVAGYDDWALDSSRFRFPFPDEDELEPGDYSDHDRGYPIPSAWTLPPEMDDHGHVQFVAQAGYNLCIPCPEGPAALADEVVRVHRNGFRGCPRIVQQAYREGDLATIVACGACRHKWRLSADAALDVAAALEAEANRTDWGPTEVDAEGRWTGPHSVRLYHSESGRERILEISRRMLAGYTSERVPA